MLDHLSLGVSNLDRSRRFYDAALRPLRLVRIVDFGRGSDYGAAPGSLGMEFTITHETGGGRPRPAPIFASARRAAVRDDGAPGLRPQYPAEYYDAFVLDPDGHRTEAGCHAPKTPLVLGAG